MPKKRTDSPHLPLAAPRFKASALAKLCGKGPATIHDYRARGILVPYDNNGTCEYGQVHVNVVFAVDRLRKEFRLHKSEIQTLAKSITQEQLAGMRESPRPKVDKVLRKYKLPS